jgi:hypothetical protein
MLFLGFILSREISVFKCYNDISGKTFMQTNINVNAILTVHS